MEINMKYVLQTLEEIIKIDSPSGYYGGGHGED